MAVNKFFTVIGILVLISYCNSSIIPTTDMISSEEATKQGIQWTTHEGIETTQEDVGTTHEDVETTHENVQTTHENVQTTQADSQVTEENLETGEEKMTIVDYINKMNMSDMMSSKNSTMSAMTFTNMYDSQKSMANHDQMATMLMEIDVSSEPLLELVSSDSIEIMNKTELMMGKTYEFAGCKPYEQNVTVPNNDPTVLKLQPSCILVNRCGGCCEDPLKGCFPADTRDILVKVFKYVFTGGSIMAQKMVDTVKVVEHTKCKCACKTQPSDCNARQFFDVQGCKCRCNNQHLSGTCPRPLKRWSPDVCGCICSAPSTCTPPFKFDHSSCRCKHPNA